MHPSRLLLIVVAAGIVEGRGLPAAGTPAARFWEEALPATPMPKVIAELVQKGIDSSPLKERYVAPNFSPSTGLGYANACGKTSSSEEATGIFFHEAQARQGSVMTVSLPPAAVPAILPRDIAAKVPFGNLTDVLATFNIAPSSIEATKLRTTLCGCRKTSEQEQRACATSLEGTVQAATGMLRGSTSGHGRRVWAAASEVPRDGLPRQAYAVSAVAVLDGERHVACHDEPFPYAVFQCHMPRSSTRAYEITLSSSHHGTVTMVALCHRDTSNWDPAHQAFKILRTQPGGTPVCHFMPYANLLFGAKTANA